MKSWSMTVGETGAMGLSAPVPIGGGSVRRKWRIRRAYWGAQGWDVVRPNCMDDMASVFRAKTYEEALSIYLRESRRFRDQAEAWGLL